VSARLSVLARDERGQTLALVVLAVAVLIGLVALVVDVGGWMRAQRRAQSTADAAALAGAQDLPDGARAAATANAVAQQNWPGVDVQLPPPPDPATTIEVVTRSDVGGVFGGLTGVFGITVHAAARARAEPPAQLDAVVPIALACQDTGCTPWPEGVPEPFRYDRRDPAGSTVATLALPGVTNGTFARYATCDATRSGASDCNRAPASAPADYDDLNRPAAQVRNAIDRGGGAPHLVAIFDRYSPVTGYHVVGWAAATLTAQPQQPGQPQVVDVEATFLKLVVSSSWMSAGGAGGSPYDFGVRAIALTG